jgi:hypothetical protein
MVPRIGGGTVRIKKRLALVAAMAMLAVTVGAVAASADVDRYQGVEYELTVTEVNGNTNYGHLFHILHDPSLDWFTGSGTYSGGTESLSSIDMTGSTLSFQSDYDDADPAYTWFPSFVLEDFPEEDEGALTFVEVAPPPTDNVYAAEGEWTATETEYKNHGQYVREAEDKKAAAHSLIGMPTQSHKKNKNK